MLANGKPTIDHMNQFEPSFFFLVENFELKRAFQLVIHTRKSTDTYKYFKVNVVTKSAKRLKEITEGRSRERERGIKCFGY